MDSYRRFVRSPLYQSCILASVEGKRLPGLSSELARMGSWEEVASKSPSLSDCKKVEEDDGKDRLISCVVFCIIIF